MSITLDKANDESASSSDKGCDLRQTRNYFDGAIAIESTNRDTKLVGKGDRAKVSIGGNLSGEIGTDTFFGNRVVRARPQNRIIAGRSARCNAREDRFISDRTSRAAESRLIS